MGKGITWPTIRATQADKGIMDAIKAHDGRLKNIESKDLMLIAASLAVENNLPYDSGIQDKMSAIYFMTKAEKNVENMKDVNDMVRNFEDYAHRGILYLKDKYLETKGGEDELFMNFVELLSSKA